jgi:hypothetical protein
MALASRVGAVVSRQRPVEERVQIAASLGTDFFKNIQL